MATIPDGFVSEVKAAELIGISRETLKWRRGLGTLNPRLTATVQVPTLVYSLAEIERIKAGDSTIEYTAEQAQRDAIAEGQRARIVELTDLGGTGTACANCGSFYVILAQHVDGERVLFCETCYHEVPA